MAAQKDYHVQFLQLWLSEVTETGLATAHASYNTITIGPHIINPFVRYMCSWRIFFPKQQIGTELSLDVLNSAKVAF